MTSSQEEYYIKRTGPSGLAMDAILLQSKGDTFLDHQHSIRYPSHDYYKYNHIESGILYKK